MYRYNSRLKIVYTG